MSSRLNSTPATKQQAYRELLKYNIQPRDKMFSARETINKINSVERYLLSHSITFEEHHIINHSDDWDDINPQSAFTYNSLMGKHAPDRTKIGSHGVVFTFNNNSNGTFQFVISDHGIAYRQINSVVPWLYLGQGLPSSVDVNQIMDKKGVANYFNSIKMFYVSSAQFNSETAKQEHFNYMLSSSSSASKSKADYEFYNPSGKVGSLSSATDSQFKSASSVTNDDRIAANTSAESLDAKYGDEIDKATNSILPNLMTETANSLTGSYQNINESSNYNQYSFGSNVPNHDSLQTSYNTNGHGWYDTPGSVYVNASLIDEAFNFINTDSASNEKYLTTTYASLVNSNIAKSANSITNSALASNYSKGQGYKDVSELSYLNSSTSSDQNINIENYNSLSYSASSNATVMMPSGYSAESNVFEVGSIQPQNGVTIMGNGYEDDYDQASLTSDMNDQHNEQSAVDTANSLTYSAVNSFISKESNLATGSSIVNNIDTENALNQQYSYAESAVKEDFNRLNQERKANHLEALNYSAENQIIADLRVKALEYVYSLPANLRNDETVHGETKSTDRMVSDYMVKIADALGFSNLLNGVLGENAASWGIGAVDYPDGQNNSYKATIGNSTQAADVINNAYMYHDRSQNDGHMHNILNSDFRYVGIAYGMDPNTHKGIEVEVFSSDNDDYLPLKTEPIDTNNINFDFNLMPSNSRFSKYILENAIPVQANTTYHIQATVNTESNPDTFGTIGVTTSPYLATYLDPTNEQDRDSLNNIGNISASVKEINNQINLGIVDYYFTPNTNVDNIWIVSIPSINGGTPKYTNVVVTSEKNMTNKQAVNSVASANADNISTLESERNDLNNQINILTSAEGSDSDTAEDYSQHFDSLDNNPMMSMVATKSMASSLSDQESYSDPTVFIYPRFTSDTGINSRTEEKAIDWCNNGAGGDLPICEQDLIQQVDDNVQQNSGETNFEFKYRKLNLARQMAGINKAKVAAILGIIQAKTNFGQSGDDPKNYLGYRDYDDEYSDIEDYLTNILAQTVGGWNFFKGGFSWYDNQFAMTGLTIDKLAQTSGVSADDSDVLDKLPYFLSYWLDMHIDSSNTDEDQCGQNAENLVNILY